MLFRRLPDNPSGSEDGSPQPLHHQSQKKFIPGRVSLVFYFIYIDTDRLDFVWIIKENKTYAAIGYSVGYGYGRRTDWSNVILPGNPGERSGVQSKSYIIRNLEAGQNYEVKVQAKNKFGWSPLSEAFTFQTTDRGCGIILSK